MIKPRGSVYLSIGAMGMVVLAGLGILISPFVIAIASWLGKLVRNIELAGSGSLPTESYLAGAFIARLISGLGLVLGILILVISGFQLALGILTWKRRDDLERTSFPLAVGIAFSILSLPAGFTAWGLIQLAFPVLVIVGAALNRQEAQERRTQAFYYPPAPVATDPVLTDQAPVEQMPEEGAEA